MSWLCTQICTYFPLVILRSVPIISFFFFYDTANCIYLLHLQKKVVQNFCNSFFLCSHVAFILHGYFLLLNELVLSKVYCRRSTLLISVLATTNTQTCSFVIGILKLLVRLAHTISPWSSIDMSNHICYRFQQTCWHAKSELEL